MFGRRRSSWNLPSIAAGILWLAAPAFGQPPPTTPLAALEACAATLDRASVAIDGLLTKGAGKATCDAAVAAEVRERERIAREAATLRETVVSLLSPLDQMLSAEIWKGRVKQDCEQADVQLGDEGTLIVVGEVKNVREVAARLERFAAAHPGLRLSPKGLAESGSCATWLDPDTKLYALERAGDRFLTATKDKMLKELEAGRLRVPDKGECRKVGELIDGKPGIKSVVDGFWVANRPGDLWICAPAAGRWEDSYQGGSSVPSIVFKSQ